MADNITGDNVTKGVKYVSCLQSRSHHCCNHDCCNYQSCKLQSCNLSQAINQVTDLISSHLKSPEHDVAFPWTLNHVTFVELPCLSSALHHTIANNHIASLPLLCWDTLVAFSPDLLCSDCMNFLLPYHEETWYVMPR
jgi:hypothetical protein